MKKYLKLRQIHNKFIYESFRYRLKGGDLLIDFSFAIYPDITFNPKIVIKKVNKSLVEKMHKQELDNLVFHLGLAEIPSYWKVTASPEIVIKAGYLNREQVDWWKEFILDGMGEFFYKNGVDFRSRKFLKISVAKGKLFPRVNRKFKNRTIVPVGGGKDSIVTVEFLKRGREEIKALIYNPTPTQKSVLSNARLTNPIIIQRSIDPKLLELNKSGYLNGHTPFSAYLAFLSVLAAAIFDYKHVAVSNEQSSNEGNINYLGRVVNHQYSKSSDFEKKFSRYSKKYLTNDINYFSFLRPLNELQITRLFSKLPQYFGSFLSCNEAYKTHSSTKEPTGRWCGKCPKCLFVFISLYPFRKRAAVEIFGRNLFEDRSLLPVFQELTGDKRFKPFECVGTKEEVLTALWLSLKNENNKPQKYLLKYFYRAILPKCHNVSETAKKILSFWGKHDMPPRHYRKLFLSTLGLNSVVILGFGREGIDAYLWIKKHFPQKTVGIADALALSKMPPGSRNLLLKAKNTKLHLGKTYLKSLKDYEIIVKSPGISLDVINDYLLPEHTVLSATRIFFELCPGTIIGVTGTKGKSTTSSLIYKVLKEGGIKTHLVGNIEKPVLDLLDRSGEDDVFVYELSSFQLDTLNKSPHISVILNIYKEHLDYHKRFDDYVNSKGNITRFQNSSDFLIFNADDKNVREVIKNSKAAKLPFRYLKCRGIKFIASTEPAKIVGKLLGVPTAKISEAIEKFKPLPHRLEYVGTHKGIQFYNDSLATVPEATAAAIASLGDDVETLIAGGFDRGLDFSGLARAILKSKIKNLILFPATGKKIARSVNLAKKRNLLNFYFPKDMNKAIKFCYQVTNKGKICLLSPASPSFGMFRDYKDRGDQFKNAAKQFSVKS